MGFEEEPHRGEVPLSHVSGSGCLRDHATRDANLVGLFTVTILWLYMAMAPMQLVLLGQDAALLALGFFAV